MTYLFKPNEIPGFKKKRKKHGPSEYKRAHDHLWSVLSLFIRLREKRRSNGKCFICGKRNIEVAYHFIPRRWSRWFFEPDNLCGACSSCNYGEMIQRGPAHDDTVRAAHIRMVGEERVKYLEEHKRDEWKKSAAELREMAQYFKNLMELGKL